MSEDRFPTWGFGAISVALGAIGFFLGLLTLEGAIIFAGFFGLPTWFIGLLWFGMKSDELLGAENAFAYETVPEKTPENKE